MNTPSIDRDCSNICKLFLESPHLEKYIRDQYLQVLTELESYGLMVFERNLDQMKLFDYDAKLVEGIHRSIEDVPGIIMRKIQESKTKKFSKFGLGEKFALVKKIFELLENSGQRMDLMLEEVKYQYFLGREIVTELMIHLAQKEASEKVEPREEKNRHFVYDFFYKNFKHFRLSQSDAMYILDKFFNSLYRKADLEEWEDHQGKSIGLKKLYPGETLKVKKIGKQGQVVYGEFAEVGLVYGVIFYKNGDVYAGHTENMTREGRGWLRSSQGEVSDGHWRHGKMVRGVSRFPNGSEIVDFRSNNRRAVWIYKDSDFPKPKLQKARDKQAKAMINLVQCGLYEGGFQGRKRHGQGKMYYSDCSIYVGGWINGLRHGSGHYLTDKGEEYKGEWAKNLREGWGSMTFSNGDFYKGQWKEGLMHGRGIMERADGKIQDGEWNSNDFVAKKLNQDPNYKNDQKSRKSQKSKNKSKIISEKKSKSKGKNRTKVNLRVRKVKPKKKLNNKIK